MSMSEFFEHCRAERAKKEACPHETMGFDEEVVYGNDCKYTLLKVVCVDCGWEDDSDAHSLNVRYQLTRKP